MPFEPDQIQPNGFIPEDNAENKSITDAYDLLSRFGKETINAIPEAARNITYGVGGGRLLSVPVAYLLSRSAKKSGIDLSIKDAHKLFKQSYMTETGKFVPEFEVAAPRNIPEQLVDTAAGLTKFVGELAVLQKIAPGASEKSLWEAQNLISGGTPGQGALMHSVFGIPGKLIPGTSKLAGAARLGAESALLGGTSALEQKLTTGQIDWTDVAISAGIPPALRSLGYVTSRIKAGDKKVIEAARKVEAKQPSEELVTYREYGTGNIISTPKNVVYRTSKEPYSPSKVGKEGIHLSADESFVKSWAETHKRKPSSIETFNISNDAKILRRENIPKRFITEEKNGATTITDDSQEALTAYAKEQGYDGYEFWDYNNKGQLINPEYVILNPNVITKTISTETNIDTTIKKIQDYAARAGEFRKTEREPAVKEFRAKQAAGGKEQLEINKDKTAQERLRSIGKGMYGKAEKGEFQPPPLEDAEWNGISQKALDVYGDDVFKLKPLQDSLDNWRNTGKLPTNYELGLLEPVIGTATVEKLYEAAQKQRKFSPWDIPDITISALKSPFNFDPQAARQLAPIMFRRPLIYAKAVWRNIRAYLSKDYATKLGAQLEADPMWRISQEKAEINLLGTKPWKTSGKAQTRLQQYGDFTEWLSRRKNRIARGYGKIMQASERGANLGIDYGMLELAKKAGKRLERIQDNLIKRGKQPWTETQIEKYWKDAGKDINGFTKRVIARHPTARKIQRAANYILFSPAYTVSYPYRSWRALRELFAGTPGNRTVATQYVLSQIGALTALSGVVAYIGHKHRLNNPAEEPPIDSSINPMNSLWGHFRHGTNVYDFTFGESSYYRLLARIGVSAVLYGETLATGKQHTLVGGRTVPKAGEEFKRYLTSRETVALGLAKALITGKDWLGEPIDTQFVINSMMPLSALKDLVDAGYANGTWQAMAQGDIAEGSKKLLADVPATLTGSFGAGVTSYKVNPAVTRSNFRNILAKKEYKKSWNDLSQLEQRKLETKYRDEFGKLNEQVRAYNVERPTSLENLRSRIMEEERKSGDIVRKKLNADVKDKLKSVSLNVSRSPGRQFLNDERYNRYLELIVENLNKRVPRLRLERLRPDVRKTLLQATVTYAKNKAYSDLRRETK